MLSAHKVSAPSAADVEFWHDKYMQALQTTFDKYKAEVRKSRVCHLLH